ncbi:hypothetical protein FIV00_03705 [Labrenzia sp. THAF82]|uniref:hypothetical protein n=1 Tax=Labrenzia sp. THAF82 TaxID=2587861 RepID=UPI001267A075|nr:hypothetical protein [Labrenzia sp. THAF82]QFT29575.1 hypothetical protein FIV00_03705 [Labrenzia sp. THAF82]
MTPTMKISTVIDTLLKIHEEFGDINITGGRLSEDCPLRIITVTDTSGHQVWPSVPGKRPLGMQVVDGVRLY